MLASDRAASAAFLEGFVIAVQFNTPRLSGRPAAEFKP
jgi:hypothetical protein